MEVRRKRLTADSSVTMGEKKRNKILESMTRNLVFSRVSNQKRKNQ